MLAQTVQGFISIRMPNLAHVESLLTLHFDRRKSFAILLLHNDWLTSAVKEAQSARSQVNLHFQLCRCENCFARAVRYTPLCRLTAPWTSDQAFAREEGAILRKGNANHIGATHFKLEE